MGELADKLKSVTSKGAQTPAMLVLEDGTVFNGSACGAQGEAFGEICFNTSLEGYLEVITDPSYAGQIITMTYPQIGNYGVQPADAQSATPALRGLVVRDLCRMPSNWRSSLPLHEYLEQNGIVAIEGIDTRALVRHIREQGAMKAGITTLTQDATAFLEQVIASESLVGANLVQGVSCPAHYDYEGAQGESFEATAFALEDAAPPEFKVVAYDCGVKRSILDGLQRSGCALTVVPWNTPAEEVLAMQPSGVFLSNGPGDPDAVQQTYDQVQQLLGKVPLFGICLGHQMICKAAGASMQKLKYGHRGGNHPVMNLLTRRVEITAQNHGFNLVFDTLGPLVPELIQQGFEHCDDLRAWVKAGIAPVVENERFGRIQLTHVNLNDGTAEGIAFLDLPAFSVQYHPEANPGPTDSHYLFDAFAALMRKEANYLHLDISDSRTQGWRF